jgi:Tol biopolymer transport system component
LSWSPDGEKIAFWASDGQNDWLAVVNTLTGGVENYCVSSVSSGIFSWFLPAPIWSSDGKLLMVENRYQDNASRLLVVDMDRKFAFPIANDVSPIGWMEADK